MMKLGSRCTAQKSRPSSNFRVVVPLGAHPPNKCGVGLDYSQRLIFVGLETLEVMWIKYDLIVCYKILNGEASLNCNHFDLSALTYTRGHEYKLYKQQSSVNAYKYFFQ